MEYIEQLHRKQKAFFRTGATKSVAFRVDALKKMQRYIRENEAELLAAMKTDLNKAPFEAYATEVGLVLDELAVAISNVGRWSKDKMVPAPMKQFPSKAFIRSEPYGVVLIIAPWNYPFMLTLAPLVGVIAAGNCAIIKPSEFSIATSAAIHKMIDSCFAPEYIAVVEGAREESEFLLSLPFHHICFTGSVPVGKVVMEAAAKHLTPVTLELGGKSPCIVTADADIPLSAKRIAWGKFVNAGQTCVAPDYILVDPRVKDQLVAGIIAAIKDHFGNDPVHNDEFPKIITKRHFDRLIGLMEGCAKLCGGQSDGDLVKIAPTLLDNPDPSSKVMSEEIFGPLLPIIPYQTLDQAIDYILDRPSPLALYVFTKDKRIAERVITEIPYGGGCVNDVLVHLASSHMPFGGVGESGMGGYHGRYGFDTFSHRKSILDKSLEVDIQLRYPPYGDHLKELKKLK